MSMTWKRTLAAAMPAFTVNLSAAVEPESTLADQVSGVERLLLPAPSWNRDHRLVQRMQGRRGENYVVVVLSGNKGGSESLQTLVLLERRAESGDYALQSFLRFAGRSDDILIRRVLPEVRIDGDDLLFTVEGLDDRPESSTRGRTRRRNFRIEEGGALRVAE